VNTVAFKLIYDGSSDKKQMREYYSGALKDLLKNNPNVVVGEADIGMGTFGPDYHELKKTYGDRYYDVGIQEANLIGVAAGLSVTGKVPYVHSFSPFITRRTYDTIFVSLAYAKLNARLYGSDPGINAAYNGGTHMAFEDVGIMRAIPDITIIDVVDGAMLDFVLRDTADRYGLYYFRAYRSTPPVKVYGEGSTFSYGKANILREGNDVAIIACGMMVPKALQAAKLLEDQGISARVVDIFTIKPIDEECVIKCAKDAGAVVVAENHRSSTGLASVVADVLVSAGIACAFGKIGVGEEFGQVGSEDYLAEYYKLTAQDIVEKAKITVTGKKSI